MNLTREQAHAVLQARAAAQDTLTGYARYIDIPGVPESGDVGDREYRVVETPLARHHVLTLNALQLMVQGLLVYDPDTLASPLTWSVLRGDGPDRGAVGVTPPRGRPGGTPPAFQVHDPSLKSHDLDEFPTSPSDGAINRGDIRHPLGGIPTSGAEAGDLEAAIPTDPPILADYDSQIALDAVLRGVFPPDTAREVLFKGRDAYDLKICNRVMIMEPPGSAKSTYASVVFPTWLMGKVKGLETILTGWGDPICRRHGKRARQICASPQYKAVFDQSIDPATKAAEDWALTNGSSYKSSGIQSGVAGFRTQCLIWDDLTKNRKEADSITIRNDVYNAYIDDARSRKTPNAWEVGIGTRWHEDEIMGRTLPEGYAGESGFIHCRDGNVWLVICLAAQCERDDDPLGRAKGEYLWDEWFGEEYWAEKKRNPRSWASLYQQRPSPEEGLYFQREKFRRYDIAPANLNRYLAFDPAVTQDEDRDSTVIQDWGVSDDGRLFFLNEWDDKCTMDVWIAELLRMGIQAKPMEIVSEAGVIRRAAEPFILRAMRKVKAFFTFTWVTRHADKSAMARAAQAMVNAGQVYVPNTSLGDRFIDECLRFPAGKEDHRVDAFANLCLRLEALWEANPTPQPEEKSSIIGGIPIKSLMPPRFPKKESRWKLN